MSDYRGQPNLARGIRNNNPGNIKTGDAWQGSAGSDGTFVIFSDMAWGVRAMGTALTNMQKKGIDTIRKLVTAWAPPVENITSAYVSAVSRDTGIGPDVLLILDTTTLAAVMRAMIAHENGQDAAYVKEADIQDGISRMNAGLLSLLPAAVTAAEEHPGMSALVIIGVGALVLLLLNKK